MGNPAFAGAADLNATAASSLAPLAEHDHRNIGAGQDFGGMTAQHDPAHAGTAMRGHHDDVAAAFMRGVKNGWCCSTVGT